MSLMHHGKITHVPNLHTALLNANTEPEPGTDDPAVKPDTDDPVHRPEFTPDEGLPGLEPSEDDEPTPSQCPIHCPDEGPEEPEDPEEEEQED